MIKKKVKKGQMTKLRKKRAGKFAKTNKIDESLGKLLSLAFTVWLFSTFPNSFHKIMKNFLIFWKS